MGEKGISTEQLYWAQCSLLSLTTGKSWAETLAHLSLDTLLGSTLSEASEQEEELFYLSVLSMSMNEPLLRSCKLMQIFNLKTVRLRFNTWKCFLQLKWRCPADIWAWFLTGDGNCEPPSFAVYRDTCQG